MKNYLQTTPKATRQLIYINLIVFIIVKITTLSGFNIILFLGLVPESVVKDFKIWQIATYMFTHYHFFHLFINLFMLWMLGSELEKHWGKAFFIKYYFITGIGAAISIILLSFINPKSFLIPTIGASGSVFGLLLAYGVSFKNRILYLYGLLPIKAFNLVILLGIVEFLYLVSNPNSTISHIGHLGGLLTGLMFLRFKKIERENKLKKYYEWKEKNIN